MGCTNSGMVHEGATNLVNNAKDLADKGEHLVYDIEETAKETMDNVQNKIKEIAHKTGDNIESAVQNLSDKLTISRNNNENDKQEPIVNVLDDHMKMAEELSESETIPITETYEEAEMKVMEIYDINDEHSSTMDSPNNIVTETNDNDSVHSKKSNHDINEGKIEDVSKEVENMKNDTKDDIVMKVDDMIIITKDKIDDLESDTKDNIILKVDDMMITTKDAIDDLESDTKDNIIMKVDDVMTATKDTIDDLESVTMDT